MKHEERIKEEAEKTINLLDEIKELEPNPFLYTRIQQRLDERNAVPAGKLKTRRIFQTAFLLIILIINTFTIVNYVTSTDSTSQQITTSTTSTSAMEKISKEYGFVQSSYIY